MSVINFLDDNGTFYINKPENVSGLYFPVAQNMGIKSSVSPNFGGDSKYDQNSFLLEPVSVENLNNNRGVRNFWVKTKNDCWSAVGASALQDANKFTDMQDESKLEAGFMWQKVDRVSKKLGITASVLDFAPINEKVEIFQITIKNTTNAVVEFIPTAAIPLFCRSADNIRDHRHVTSLLHRIHTTDDGVLVTPTLSFDERGHKKNNITYFVLGVTGDGKKPVGFYPVLDDFIGEGGTLTRPRSIYEEVKPVKADLDFEGEEAMGGLVFEKTTLKPNEERKYTIIMGATADKTTIAGILDKFNSDSKVLAKYNEAKNYWIEKVNVSYKTGNEYFDGFMKWVSFQPFLRRVFGCSFLPHHDYGRGGRGWRDLWQDCLSLLIMDPSGVRQMIIDNYGGVRIDGTNATIIGEKPGEFVADRNGIARVWMDHAVWPFMTTKLYLNQTGDVDVLKESQAYFKDEQTKRGTALDKAWEAEYGVHQKTNGNAVYKGTILEHMLLEVLCSFYEVGEHNHIKLRGADWNDALDMAAANGESVAFTAAYAGNLDDLASLLNELHDKYGWNDVEILEEITLLLDVDTKVFDDIEGKKAILDKYLEACLHNVSGNKVRVDILKLAKDLEAKAMWIKKHIRETEWISSKDSKDGWFNSYYDNSKNKVEGFFDSGVRMMLTGQVFTIMSGTATNDQIKSICESADKYLYKPEVGGYRLNTNFHEVKLDLGRAFGFAYGEKENGAVFSHMTVMYANALYQRGFVREGYKALQTLADNAANFETSKIYPGIPEYFNAKGRGLYHYLTGAASWYMLTFITEVFGVKGNLGDLTVEPKLVKEQYDANGTAKMSLYFAEKKFEVVVNNKKLLDYGQYKIASATLDGKNIAFNDNKATISIDEINKLDNKNHNITITLE